MMVQILSYLWTNSWVVGISETVAIAAVATLGYLCGRRIRIHASLADQEQAQQELKRAATIAQELENIAVSVRKDVAAHHQSVERFKSRLADLTDGESAASCKALYDEAEKILAPTLKLAAQLSNAYDKIRQQSSQLLTFTEVRTDPLTGASNRRALDDQLKILFDLLSRDNRPFSLAIFDIDHIKKINDEKGLPYGDQVLQAVAKTLKDCVRDTDFVARYGGEEFVVVMPQTRLAGASVFGERLRAMVEHRIKVTVSGGIAEALAQDSIQSLLSRADSALYSAKASGRNAVFQHNGHTIRRVESQAAGDGPGQETPDELDLEIDREVAEIQDAISDAGLDHADNNAATCGQHNELTR